MINSVSSFNVRPTMSPVSKTEESSAIDVTKSFGSHLSDAIAKLETQEQNVDKLTTDFITDKPVDVHTLMIETQKAELGLQLTVQVRNKVVEAYQEIMRTQI